MSGEVETDEAVNGAGTIETEAPFIACLSSSVMNDEDGIANGSVNE